MILKPVAKIIPKNMTRLNYLTFTDAIYAIASKVLKFAADTKVFRKIKSDADRQHLQDDLNKLTDWSEKWQMLFNFGKCKCLHKDMGMKMHNIQWVVLY